MLKKYITRSRIIACLLCVTTLLSITSCGNEQTSTTSTIAQTETPTTPSKTETTTQATHSDEQVLEITDHWTFIPKKAVGDKKYLQDIYFVHNPEGNQFATYPKINVEIKNGKNEILAAESQTASLIMPGDTIPICVQIPVLDKDFGDDAMTEYYEECRFSDSHSLKGARTTDYVISNVSMRSGDYSKKITGEITCNFGEMINETYLLIVVCDKDDYLTWVDTSFIENLKPGQSKAFDVDIPSDVPDSDNIDVFAYEWL